MAKGLFTVGTSTVRFYIDRNSGGVGIGTSTVAAGRALHVSGNTYVDGDFTIRNQSNLTAQWSFNSTHISTLTCGQSAANTCIITAGGNAVMNVNTANSATAYVALNATLNVTSTTTTDRRRVGIATTTPYGKLQVVSSIFPQLMLSNASAGTNLKHWVASTTPAGGLVWGTLNDALTTISPTITFLTGGNVGIGTTTPSALLDIAGALGSQTTLFNVSSTTATNIVSSLFNINANGNVGIGTTSPYAKLSVVGQVVASHFTATSTTATSTFASSLTIGNPLYVYADPTRNSFAVGNAIIGGATVTSVNASGYGSIGFGQVDDFSGANNANITSSGFGSLAGGYVLARGANKSITSSGYGSVALGYIDLTAGSNILSSGSGSFAMGDSSVAGTITASGNGSVAWGQNITASNSLSFAFGSGYTNSTANTFNVGFSATPTLTVNATNVGIGTTSPYAKLSVVGGVNSTSPSFIVATTSTWGAGQQPLLFVTATTSGQLDFARVAIGTTSPWGNSGLRDQLTVDGRIYTTWRYLSCDIAGSAVTSATALSADTAGACGNFAFDFDTRGTAILGNTSYPPYIELRSGHPGGPSAGEGSALRTAIMVASATSSPIFEAWVSPSRPAIATTTPLMIVGLANTAFGDDIATMPTQGAYFIATSTPNWKMVTRSANNVETMTDSGIATSSTVFQKMRIELNTTEAIFLANGNVIARHTTNIPQATLQPQTLVGTFEGIQSTVANSDQRLLVSLIRFWMDDPPGGMPASSFAQFQQSPIETEQVTLSQEEIDSYNSVSAAAITAPYLVGDPALFAEGSVVAIHEIDRARVRLSNKAYDANTFGVVGMTSVLNLGDTNKNTINVAMSGRVPVRISLENGEILPGDYITSSSISGVAMKATASGPVIGRAIEKYASSSVAYKDTITVALAPAHYSGNALTQNTFGNVGIGTTSEYFKLNVSGDVGAYGFGVNTRADLLNEVSTVGSSDLDSYLGAIKTMNISTYRYNSENPSAPLRLGIIASNAPSSILSVSGDSVDIYKLATLTLGGVKALSNKFDSLELRVSVLENQIFGNASSTATSTATSTGIATTTPTSFIDSMMSYLESLGVSIVDGIARFKKVIVETLTVGSSEKPSGITLYDEVTGEPYCLKISNGQTKTDAGECGTVTTTTETTQTPTTETATQGGGSEGGGENGQGDTQSGSETETETSGGEDNSAGGGGESSEGETGGDASGEGAGGESSGGSEGGESGGGTE